MRIYRATTFGNNTNEIIHYDEVKDYTVLDCIGSNAYQYHLDCVPSNPSLINSIQWRKEEGMLRFPVTTEVARVNQTVRAVKRLKFAHNFNVVRNDYGVYTCFVDDEFAFFDTVSIELTGGKCSFLSPSFFLSNFSLLLSSLLSILFMSLRA